MSIKKANQLTMVNTAFFAVLLTLAGCVSTQGGKGVKSGDANKGTGIKEIATMNFAPPQQIQWKQIQNQQKDGNILAEWVPQKNTSKNTPVRIVYRRFVSNQSASDFLLSAIQPFKKMCPDVKANAFKTKSSYANQAGAEVLCSRLGKAKFGMVSYWSVFADGKAAHLLMSEVKTPSSEKAGVIQPKNKKQRQWANASSQLAQLMGQFNANVQVCDAKKQCQ
ncbi:MAG: hypothetical protein CR975_01000 [Gammaproteobacteria bacterium]|nr:MAG: hypothetical protein CR975_01000 [Gammaproteobacteria bacterium]